MADEKVEYVDVTKAIEHFMKNVDTDDVIANCMFVNQNSQRHSYKGYNLNCALKTISKAVVGSLTNISNIFAESEIKPFEFEFGEDGVIQTLPKSDVVYADDILENISIQLNEKNTMSEDKNINSLNFIVIQLVSIEKEIDNLVLFKKYVKPASAFKNAVKMVFEGSEPKIIKDNIVTIGDNVDAILYNDLFYIINRRGFDSIFCYREGYKKIVQNGRDSIVESGMLSDTDVFINDCVGNGRHLPRLAKAIASGCFDEVARNMNNLVKIKETHGIKLELTPDNKIKYRGTEDIPEILNVFLDHYVVSQMTDRAMLAKSIEQYEMQKE